MQRPDLNANTLKAVAKEVSGKVAKSRAREVPTVFRSSLKVEWFRKFGLRERLAILFGHNLVVMIGIATQHSPGKIQPLIVGRVSRQLNATEHMKHVVENMLEEQAPPAHLPIPEPPRA